MALITEAAETLVRNNEGRSAETKKDNRIGDRRRMNEYNIGVWDLEGKIQDRNMREIMHIYK